MTAITIDMPDYTIAQLTELAQLCTQANRTSKGMTTHGDLTVPTLLTMLAEDATMVIRRPGSWEGANMVHVLSSHGYL